MPAPEYPYAARLADQAADSAGRRWYVKEWHDAVAAAVDLRAELLARALCATGGVAVPPDSVDLTSDVLTVTGPVVGITPDGLAPLLIDQAGAGVTLDLAAAGPLHADGTHGVVIRATPVTTSVPFTTPSVLQRDPQGNVVAEAPGESITYTPRQALGVLALITGTIPAGDEVLLLTVDVTAGTWSNAVEAWEPPRVRARLADLLDVNDAARADGYVLAWDDATSQHVYVPPGGGAPGSGSGS